MRYVIIENGVVTNAVEWDGKSGWAPPPGAQAMPNPVAGIGYTFDGSTFTPPIDVPPKKEPFTKLEDVLVAKGVITPSDVALIGGALALAVLG